MHMKSASQEEKNIIAGATVLVTGAGSGMGALYARRAAGVGAARVVLWDIDHVALGGIASEVSSLGAQSVAQRVDISQPAEIAGACAQLREAGHTPDVVINNAGIVRGAPFWEH